MPMHSKTISTQFVGAVVLASLVTPFFAGAAELPREGAVKRAAAGADICANISTMRTEALARVTERTTTLQGKKDEHKTKFAAGRTERHDALATKRSEGDAARKTQFDALSARASTTEQKSAVTTFTTEVERLISVRRTAVDAAIKAFEDGAAALQSEADSAVGSLSSGVQTDVAAAFDAAAASCTAGKTGAEVVTELKTAMQAMHTKRVGDKGTYNFKDKFEALRATRKASVEKAMADFKTGMDAARTTLKASLTK